MRNFLEAFFRRRTAIFLIAVMASGIIALATYCRTPQYVSETRFMIPLGREMGSSTAAVQAQATLLMMNYTDQIATQMEVLRNRRLIEDALARMPADVLSAAPPPPPVFRLLRTLLGRIDAGGDGAGGDAAEESSPVAAPRRTLREWLLRYGIVHELTDREGLVEACSSRLTVARQNDSGVMHLRFTHPSPAFARTFLVKYLEAYENLRASSGTAGSDMPFFAGQEERLRDDLRKASDRLADFRRQWGLLDIQAQREQHATELARLEQIINEKKTELSQAAASMAALQTDSARSEPESIFSSVMRDDPAVVHNLRSIAALLARESRLKAEVGANHPELILIQRETAELRDGMLRSALATLNTQEMNAKLQLEAATRQRTETEDRMATLEAKTVEIRAFESELEVANNALLAYGRNREAARVTSQMDDMRINSIMVVEPPTRPYSPESPKPMRDIALGAIFSIFLGLYYAYFMEVFGDNVSSIDAVAAKFPGAAAVAVPELRKLPNGDLPTPENVMAMLGRKFFYRDKRLSLPKSVVAIGGNPQAGTTAVAGMLARYMAKTYNIRVLLVDARLSAFGNPKPAKPDPANPTLSAWLLDRSVRPAPAEPGVVSVLPAGPGGSVVRAAMLRVTQNDLTRFGDFDTVVFDTAPLSSDSVSFHLAALTEMTIPVVRLEHTRKGVLQSMKDDIEMSGASVMGVVCNRRRFYIPAWIYKRLS